MFGYIKVNADELKVADYRLYRAVYCGLCKTMKKRIGRISTLSLSYDFVFLALLLSDVTGEGFNVKPKRCGLHPFKKRPMADENQALDYASGTFAILKYYKLLDDVADSKVFKKLLIKLMLPSAKTHFKRALKLFSQFHFDTLSAEIKARLDDLSELEKNGSPSCEINADVFGRLLAAVFKNYFDNEKISVSAGELGYALGVFIYIADAIDDFPSDLKKGSYNPFVKAGYTSLPKDTVAATLSRVNLKAENALAELPSNLDDLRRISENIINLGMRTVLMSLENKNNHKTHHGEKL